MRRSCAGQCLIARIQPPSDSTDPCLQLAAGDAKPLVHGRMNVLSHHHAARSDGQVDETGQSAPVDIPAKDDCAFAGYPILIHVTPACHQAQHCTHQRVPMVTRARREASQCPRPQPRLPRCRRTDRSAHDLQRGFCGVRVARGDVAWNVRPVMIVCDACSRCRRLGCSQNRRADCGRGGQLVCLKCLPTKGTVDVDHPGRWGSDPRTSGSIRA